MRQKKIVFLTGTRADYGKLKSLMKKVEKESEFELYIFVTGMHMLSLYGSTYLEIEKDDFKNIYTFVNTRMKQSMDITLSNTIIGFSNYVSEFKPDLIVVHGDRIEALAGAIVGALNNIKVAHIEGGEISGTIDESIRHAITKFAHLHLVANEEAKKYVIQLGENKENVFVIGSPDMDIMFSNDLPSIVNVKKHYDIEFNKYGIFMYHPVTTEIDKIPENINKVLDSLMLSEKNYIVIYPNNDDGNEFIIDELKKLNDNERFKCFPSIRFESFLSLLKSSDFIIGNSSAGVREACVYGIPTVDIGSRQMGRYPEESKGIVHVNEDKEKILDAIEQVLNVEQMIESPYGDGDSAGKFLDLIGSNYIWEMDIQKKFIPSISQL